MLNANEMGNCIIVAEDPWPLVFSQRLYEKETLSRKIQSGYLDDNKENLILEKLNQENERYSTI